MGDEEKLYNSLVRMIGELHGFERSFWRQRWLEDQTMEDGQDVLDHLNEASHHLCMLRNKLNDLTLVGEPEELELLVDT